ncbi:hypothetical protein Bca4012_041164 [Brassica carinata]
MQLGKALGLQPRQIANWFQNRKSRLKTKQLERDYDTLKKQFDVLKSDNDSLLAHNKKLHDGKLPTQRKYGAARNIFFVGSIAFQDVAHKVSALKVFLNRGDMARLKEIQEAVLQMSAPKALRNELIHKLRSERMSYHGDESSWNRSWVAIKKLWASKWNVRAYVSRKLELTHDAVCMSVLVQESCGDYAFVIHTNNLVTGDPSEIHTRDCEGFGRDLGWRISRTSNELYHQENKPQLANREKQKTDSVCMLTPVTVVSQAGRSHFVTTELNIRNEMQGLKRPEIVYHCQAINNGLEYGWRRAKKPPLGHTFHVLLEGGQKLEEEIHRCHFRSVLGKADVDIHMTAIDAEICNYKRACAVHVFQKKKGMCRSCGYTGRDNVSW